MSGAPLLGRDAPLGDAPPAPAFAFFYPQIALAAGFTATAWLVPKYFEDMTEAAHIAAVHVILFLLVGFLALIVSRRNAEVPLSNVFWPLTPAIADAPYVFVTMVNAILLLVLGMESWVRTVIGARFSVLEIVQVLSAVELAACCIPAGMVTWRAIQYRKIMPQHKLADDGVYASPFPLRRGSSSGALGFAAQQAGNLNLSSVAALASSSADADTSFAALMPAAMPPAVQQALQERVRVLEERETALLRRTVTLTQELQFALAGSTQAHVAALMQEATQELAALQAQFRALQSRCDELETRAAWYESELKRASTDVARLRAAVRDEKKRNEKLFATLDLEREANAQAQNVIRDLQAKAAASAAAAPAAAVAPTLSSAAAAATATAAGPVPGPLAVAASPSIPIPIPLQQSSSGGGGGGGGIGMPASSYNMESILSSSFVSPASLLRAGSRISVSLNNPNAGGAGAAAAAAITSGGQLGPGLPPAMLSPAALTSAAAAVNGGGGGVAPSSYSSSALTRQATGTRQSFAAVLPAPGQFGAPGVPRNQ